MRVSSNPRPPLPAVAQGQITSYRYIITVRIYLSTPFYSRNQKSKHIRQQSHRTGMDMPGQNAARRLRRIRTL